ncbi:MAG: hypothetical protein EP321_14905 [Sphingomonadales bacterium]|nr:MAG: hypothetical protein EP345_07635 [Sphingomonadales bacterium]TNF02108.1 MAG: hypothetical protein EP321_14905 [Sphingomonadales bacterium]
MDPKPIASLSAGLLARKGAARPAMRRPHMSGMTAPSLPVSVQDDDLGWNDLGEEHHMPHPVPPLTMIGGRTAAREEHPGAVSPVEQQREMLEQSLSEPVVPVSAPVPPAAPASTSVPETGLTPVKAKAGGTKMASLGAKIAGKVKAFRPRSSKAAFTLRLDPERHLRLRLACAVGNRSAQQIVTQALDAYLDSQPQLEALARQVPVDGADSSKPD